MKAYAFDFVPMAKRNVNGEPGRTDRILGVQSLTVLQMKWAIFFCLFFTSIADFQARAAEFPAILTTFESIKENPIFIGRGPGFWDAKIRERGWVLKVGETFHLWYTGYDGTREGIRRLGHAESKDGIHWTRLSQEPILPDLWVEDMMVAYEGDTFYMFAEGARDRAQLLLSSDGNHWQPKGTLRVFHADGKPIADGPFGTPFAFKQDGIWNLFYERRDQGVWWAKSSDLETWKLVRDEPILTPGPAEHEASMIALNQIIRHEGKYYAYYHGRGKTPVWSTCLAVSDDLLHWKKYDKNPLIPRELNRSSGFVVPIGGRYRLYTAHDRLDAYESALP